METMKKIVPSYIPNELIIQILLRLPVKSLIRFKCVCKSWFSIISDTHFANSQFELNAATATHTHKALFLSTVSPHETVSIDLEASLDDDTASVSLNPNFMPSQSYFRIEIKGSCRGFILFLYDDSCFYLWNPSTGLHKQIPLSPLSFNLDTSADYFYGFGYDQSTDDYLVVSMSSGTNSSYLEFFSLRANAWKEIDEGTRIRYANATEDYRKEGSFFNGAIHWFAYRHQLEKNVIVAFDLMERKLIGMHLPDQFDLEIDYYSGLWVFREFLSLWALSHDNVTVEIWVMKEYRVHSSWTKTYVLPTDDIFTNYFSPLCCTKSGDIVGTYGRYRLVKYNDEGHLLGHGRSYFNHPYRSRVVMYLESRWHKKEDQYKPRVVMYTESLLSLPGDNVQA